VRRDEVAHQTNAFGVVENHDIHSMLPEEIFRAPKVSIFSDDDAGNVKQQRRARAHDARTQSADQRQLRPVTPPARIAQAHRFGMRCRVSTLNSEVMSSGHNLPLLVGQHGTDR